MGYNLKKMIYEVGGGIRGGTKLKAVVPGGSSTPGPSARRDRNLGMDFDQVGKAGSMLGSGGVVVIDETRPASSSSPCAPSASTSTRAAAGASPAAKAPTGSRRRSPASTPAAASTRTSTTSSTSPKTCWAAPSARSATPPPCPRIAFVKKFRKEFEDHLDGKPCPYRQASRRNELVV